MSAQKRKPTGNTPRAKTSATPRQKASVYPPAQQALRDEAYGSVRAAIAAGKPRRRMWDLVLSILGCVALGFTAIVIGYLGAILSVFPVQCENANVACDYDRINWGVAIVLLAPTVIALIAIAATIIRYLLGRVVFWIPVAAIVVCILIGFVGSWMVTSSIPGSALA